MNKYTCKDCGKEYELEEAEMEWYKTKGFDLPKRCKSCRALKKIKFINNDGRTETIKYRE